MIICIKLNVRFALSEESIGTFDICWRNNKKIHKNCRGVIQKETVILKRTMQRLYLPQRQKSCVILFILYKWKRSFAVYRYTSYCVRYRSYLGAAYLIIAVKALLWDWSFFLSYFNQCLSPYVNTKQYSQHCRGIVSLCCR